MIGRFHQDSSLDRATRLKEAQDRRAAYLADLDERDRRKLGHNNDGSCPNLLLDAEIVSEHCEAYNGSRAALKGASAVVSPPRNSRGSLGFGRPNSFLKRPSTTPIRKRKPDSLRENRQAANERAVQVYSASVALGGRTQTSRRVDCISPRCPRSPWKERRRVSAGQWRSSASEERRQPLPWHVDGVGLGGQKSAENEREGVSTWQRVPVRPPTRGGEPSKRSFRPVSAFVDGWDNEGSYQGETRVGLFSQTCESLDGDVLYGPNVAEPPAPAARNNTSAAKARKRSPPAGVRSREETPAAQRARVLELQRLASERKELEAQLEEVKLLMRVATAGKVCWKAVTAGMLDSGTPRTRGKRMRRRKRKRHLSAVPATEGAREVVDGVNDSTRQRGSGTKHRRGSREQIASKEHHVDEGSGAAGGGTRRRRRQSGDSGRGGTRRRSHASSSTPRRTERTWERAAITPGASASPGRRSSAEEGVVSPLQRQSAGEDPPTRSQRPKSVPHRPMSAPLLQVSRPVTRPLTSEEMGTVATLTKGRGQGRDGSCERAPDRPQLARHTERRHTDEVWKTGERSAVSTRGYIRVRLKSDCESEKRQGSPLCRIERFSSAPTCGEKEVRWGPVHSLGERPPGRTRATAASTPPRHHFPGTAEDPESDYEDDFEVVSAQGSYFSDSEPWDDRRYQGQETAAEKLITDQKGGERLPRDSRRSGTGEGANAAADGELCRQNSCDDSWGEYPGRSAGRAVEHSNSWSSGRQRATASRAGRTSTRRRRDVPGERGTMSQASGSAGRETHDDRGGVGFEHLWVNDSDPERETLGENQAVGENFADRRSIDGVPSSSSSSSYDEFFIGTEGGPLPLADEWHGEKLYPDGGNREERGSTAPLSEGGSSLYDILLSSHHSSSDGSWSLESHAQSDTVASLAPQVVRGASSTAKLSAPTMPSDGSANFGVVSEEKIIPASNPPSSEDGSSLYEMKSSSEHTGDTEGAALERDPSLSNLRREDQDGRGSVTRARVGKAISSVGSHVEERPGRPAQTVDVEATAKPIQGDKDSARLEEEGCHIAKDEIQTKDVRDKASIGDESPGVSVVDERLRDLLASAEPSLVEKTVSVESFVQGPFDERCVGGKSSREVWPDLESFDEGSRAYRNPSAEAPTETNPVRPGLPRGGSSARKDTLGNNEYFDEVSFRDEALNESHDETLRGILSVDERSMRTEWRDFAGNPPGDLQGDPRIEQVGIDKSLDDRQRHPLSSDRRPDGKEPDNERRIVDRRNDGSRQMRLHSRVDEEASLVKTTLRERLNGEEATDGRPLTKRNISGNRTAGRMGGRSRVAEEDALADDGMFDELSVNGRSSGQYFGQEALSKRSLLRSSSGGYHPSGDVGNREGEEEGLEGKGLSDESLLNEKPHPTSSGEVALLEEVSARERRGDVGPVRDRADGLWLGVEGNETLDEETMDKEQDRRVLVGETVSHRHDRDECILVKDTSGSDRGGDHAWENSPRGEENSPQFEGAIDDKSPLGNVSSGDTRHGQSSQERFPIGEATARKSGEGGTEDVDRTDEEAPEYSDYFEEVSLRDESHREPPNDESSHEAGEPRDSVHDGTAVPAATGFGITEEEREYNDPFDDRSLKRELHRDFLGGISSHDTTKPRERGASGAAAAAIRSPNTEEELEYNDPFDEASIEAEPRGASFGDVSLDGGSFDKGYFDYGSLGSSGVLLGDRVPNVREASASDQGRRGHAEDDDRDATNGELNSEGLFDVLSSGETFIHESSKGSETFLVGAIEAGDQGGGRGGGDEPRAVAGKFEDIESFDERPTESRGWGSLGDNALEGRPFADGWGDQSLPRSSSRAETSPSQPVTEVVKAGAGSVKLVAEEGSSLDEYVDGGDNVPEAVQDCVTAEDRPQIAESLDEFSSLGALKTPQATSETTKVGATPAKLVTEGRPSLDEYMDEGDKTPKTAQRGVIADDRPQIAESLDELSSLDAAETPQAAPEVTKVEGGSSLDEYMDEGNNIPESIRGGVIADDRPQIAESLDELSSLDAVETPQAMSVGEHLPDDRPLGLKSDSPDGKRMSTGGLPGKRRIGVGEMAQGQRPGESSDSPEGSVRGDGSLERAPPDAQRLLFGDGGGSLDEYLFDTRQQQESLDDLYLGDETFDDESVHERHSLDSPSLSAPSTEDDESLLFDDVSLGGPTSEGEPLD